MVDRRPSIDLQPVLDELGKLTAAVGRLADRVTRSDARQDETVQGLAKVQAQMEALSNRVGSIAAASQENAVQLETVARALDHVTSPAVEAVTSPPKITVKHWTIGAAFGIAAANWKAVVGFARWLGSALPPPPS